MSLETSEVSQLLLDVMSNHVMLARARMNKSNQPLPVSGKKETNNKNMIFENKKMAA